jgi:Cdc6-like AAA superfamily ATPase
LETASNHELQSLLETVHSDSEQLARSLIQAGDQLMKDGLLPPEDLEVRLNLFRDCVGKILALVHYGQDREKKPGSLEELFRLAGEWMDRQRWFAEYGKWLRMAATIASKSQEDEAMLADFRKQAERLAEEAVKQGSPDGVWREQAEPYIALVRLMQESDVLSDDEWMACEESVRTKLHEKISTALLRKRLYFKATEHARTGPIQESAPPPKAEPFEEPKSEPIAEKKPESKPEPKAEPVKEKRSVEPTEPLQAQPAASVPSPLVARKLPEVPLIARTSVEDLLKGRYFDPPAVKAIRNPVRLKSIRINLDKLAKKEQAATAQDTDRTAVEEAAKPQEEIPQSVKTEEQPVEKPLEELQAEKQPLEKQPTDKQLTEKQTGEKPSAKPQAEQPEDSRSDRQSVDGEVTESAAEGAASQVMPAAEPAPVEEQAGNSPLAMRETREWEALMWQWVKEQQLSYAYRLAEYLYAENGDPSQRMLPDLIQAALLAQHVRHNSGGIMFRLKGMFEKWITQGLLDPANDAASSYLMAAAALKPAILAPNTNALQILDHLNFKGELYKFVSTVKDFGSTYIPLELNILHNLKTESGWKADLKELQQRTKQLIKHSANPRILFQPASKVWMKWMEPNGWVNSVLNLILEHRADKAEEAREFVEHYSDPSEFRRQVQHTDRVEIGRMTGNDITARALQQLRSHFDDAMDLLREWISLVETQPGHSNEYHLRKAKLLQEGIRQQYQAVISELSWQVEQVDTPAVQASLSLLRHAIDNVHALFDPSTPLINREPDPDYVLNGPLLRIPGIGIRQDWTLYQEDDFPIGELLQAHTYGWLSFEEVFDARLEHQDIEGCQLMLEMADRQVLEQQGLRTDMLMDRMNRRLKECREALARNIKDTMKQVEVAFTHNLIDENDRTTYLSELETMSRKADQILYFPESIGLLAGLRSSLNRKREEARERMRKRFLEAGVTEEHPNYDKIQKVLNSGNLYTVQELLSRIQNNETLDLEEKERESFLEFFDTKSSMFAELNKILEEHSIKQIIQWIKSGKNFGPLAISQVPGAQRNQAAEMLEAWLRAKRSSGKSVVEERDIRTILNHIGLFVKSVQRHSTPSKSRDYQIIHTEVLADHNRCPVAQYGSEAGGQYRLFSFWERLTEEDILHEIGDTGHGQLPAIVFFFGRLTAMRRRDLARLCRERRRTFIILDEILILYLCGERGSRLPVFFKCALPFTYLEPYTTTASMIPTEMFFGRKSELQSIMEGRSGLVYGGRQLGKTALLREAERRFHSPDEGRYAVWIDLKAEGIGYNKSPNDIWSVIAKELNRIGIQEIKPNVTSPDKLFSQIQEWLDKNRQRRILLLLDESDRFLEMDATDYGAVGEEGSRNRAGFIRCSKIKGLMEKTNKRFHVVFAGLHNVQRSFKNQNDPLAHLGQAICVGPLLSEQEWKEARDLIQKPLAALGYFFESPDLIIQILSQTNYYPSLIQLYCHQLLRHLTEHRALASFSTKQTPPYIITSKHVDEAYQDRELQQAIKHRFQLTLQLDQRYELIAHVIAYESLTDEEVSKTGIPVKDIRTKAIEFWPEGFEATATDSFRVLLDEMVDLGVLRRVMEGYYTLRSPNLISLMGTLSEIEEELLRDDRVLQAEYDAAHFRPTYHMNGAEDISLRSPITAEQESELLQSPSRVAVIFGHQGAGIGDVEKFLQAHHAAGQSQLYTLKGMIEYSAFIRQVREIADRSLDQEVRILVDTDCTWTMDWIKEVKRLIGSSKRFEKVRVVFLADARQTFALVRANLHVVDEIFEEGIVILQLKPWHPVTLGLWLSDCELEHTRQAIDMIADTTGNWPSLLYRLYRKVKKNPHQLRQHIQELQQEILQKDVLTGILEELGIMRDEDYKVFKVLSLANAKPDDIADFCELPAELVRSVLVSAELLGTVRHVGKDVWQADPVVAKLMQEVGDPQ